MMVIDVIIVLDRTIISSPTTANWKSQLVDFLYSILDLQGEAVCINLVKEEI